MCRNTHTQMLRRIKNIPMVLTMTTLLQEFREEKPREIKHLNIV